MHSHRVLQERNVNWANKKQENKKLQNKGGKTLDDANEIKKNFNGI